MTRLQACLLASLALSVANCATAREVAFLAHPRIENAGLFKTQSVSEQRGPYLARPNAQLIVRNLATGAERVLVDRNVLDFSVSIDGTNLLVSIVDGYISKKSPGRCDVWRVDVASGTKTRLTNGPGWNCQPIELGDGSLAFLSNRDGWKSPKEVYRAFTIYHMNAQGGEQQRIWHAGIGGIFGLNLMPSGRILFASGEQQGHRVGRGNHWSIWSINPDGSDFAPEMSAIGLSPFVEPFDWPCIASDGSLVFTQYYDTRVYGVILAAPVWEAIPFGPLTMFGHPVFKRNPGYIDRNRHRFRLGFERRGLYSLTPQTSVHDAEIVSGTRPVGIYSHPWPIPGNKIYATWTGSKGDANSDVGVYEISLDAPISDYKQLTKVIDEPTRHEWMGKQLVSFAEIYGIDRPPMPTCPKTDLLPPGSPFALIGTSAVDINEWVLVPKSNPLANPLLVTTDESDPARDPYYVRILAFNPTMDRKPTKSVKTITNATIPNYEGFYSQMNERVGFYEQLIPLKKYRTPDGKLYVGPNPPAGSTRILRADGRPDSSFACFVPANQPWSVQLLNAKKEAIVGSTAQTWHQSISREQRTNCQGCHAHNKPDQTLFVDTIAASAEYLEQIQRLETVERVVYDRDLQSFAPQLAKALAAKAYQSSVSTLDDDPVFSPKQAELVRAWIDTGGLAAGEKRNADRTYSRITPESGLGPYADTMGPTLVVECLPDRVVIGAHDPDSGLDLSTLSLTLDGAPVPLTHNEAERLWTWPHSHTSGVLVARVKDQAGNETRIERLLPVSKEGQLARLRAE